MAQPKFQKNGKVQINSTGEIGKIASIDILDSGEIKYAIQLYPITVWIAESDLTAQVDANKTTPSRRAKPTSKPTPRKTQPAKKGKKKAQS